MRAGARWYELTHDRLIEPISKSNEKFERMEEQRRAEAQSRARIARCLRRIAAALVVICIVTLPPIMIYLSVFPHSLTVSFVGGSVTKNPDKARYSDGETVILEAVPNEGYVFANWSGDLSDSNNPVVLIMDSKKLVQANFLLTYSLTVNVINGSVMKDPNQEYYDVNDTVTLTAMPNNEKFTFRGWSGDLPESSDPNNTTLKLVMNGEKSVTASFEAPDNIQQVTLTARFDWYDTWDSRDKWITQGLDVDTNKVVTSPGWQRSPMKFGKPIELTSWCTQASQGQWRLHFNVPFVQLSSVPYDYFSEYTQQKIKKMLSDGDVVKIPVQNPGDYSYNVKDIFFFKTTEESYAKLHVLDRTVRGESGYSRRGILKIRYVVYNGN